MKIDYPLPAEITSPYPYVALRDLEQVVTRIHPNISKERVTEQEARLSAIQEAYSPPDSTHYSLDSTVLNNALDDVAEAEISRTDTQVGVVHLDKHIGRRTMSPHYFRLNISRNADNELAPRLGSTESYATQMTKLQRWLSETAYKEVIFMDDVLAFASTLPRIIEEARVAAPETKVRVSVALAASGGIWRGIETLEEKTGIAAEYLTKIEASPEVPNGSLGMAIPPSGDLTLFGGKVGPMHNDIPTNIPYMLPFSIFRSVFDSRTAIEASSAILDFNHNFVNLLEDAHGRSLRLTDTHAVGLGTPVSSLEPFKNEAAPDIHMRLHDVIDYYQSLLVKHTAELEDLLFASETK